mmetsp:Transcript_22811/g.63504  ORF Transcript_22811/g.63504 Transcript_22811/m.63504 type:complete len:231 (-) Transcript_22811:14-706(-)
MTASNPPSSLSLAALAGALVTPSTLQPLSLYSCPAIMPVALAADVTITVFRHGASTLPVSTYSVACQAVNPADMDKIERYLYAGRPSVTLIALPRTSFHVMYRCNGYEPAKCAPVLYPLFLDSTTRMTWSQLKGCPSGWEDILPRRDGAVPAATITVRTSPSTSGMMGPVSLSSKLVFARYRPEGRCTKIHAGLLVRPVAPAAPRPAMTPHAREGSIHRRASRAMARNLI